MEVKEFCFVLLYFLFKWSIVHDSHASITTTASTTSSISPLKSLVIKPGRVKPKAVVIFLHGASTTGPTMCAQMLDIYPRFFLPHVKYMFPTSANRTVNGETKRAWFDRPRLALNSSELFQTIDPPCEQIHRIVQNQIRRGIESNRIFVGGYSMGGALALFYAYRFLPLHHRTDYNLGGAFALSAFLNLESQVYDVMDHAIDRRFADLFMAHGRHDDVVDVAWALDTLEKLKSRGVDVRFELFEDQDHDPTRVELEKLKTWINEKLK